jgi:hypothetical protein
MSRVTENRHSNICQSDSLKNDQACRAVNLTAEAQSR